MTRSPTLDQIVADGLANDVIVAVLRADGRRRRHRRMAGGAAIMAVVAAVMFWRSDPRPLPLPERIAARTDGVPTHQVLSDGSRVELDGGARINVAFTPLARLVELKGGSAHFQVTKDARRPFIVTAGTINVRAVGTAFAIQFGRSELEVIVTEGRVSVAENSVTVPKPAGTSGSPLGGAITLDAGHRVLIPTIGADELVKVPQLLSVAEINDRLQWRIPRLELSGTSLADIVATFNQYSGKRLVIGDTNLNRLELSGTLRADNVDALLRLLHAEFGVVAAQHGEELMLRSP